MNADSRQLAGTPRVPIEVDKHPGGFGYSPHMSTTIAVRHLSDDPTAERLIPEVLPWILEAGAPYLHWLLGPETAEQIGRWMRRPSSEVAIGRAVVTEVEGSPVGGYVAVDGHELASCRIADALAALADAREDRDLVRARIEGSRRLFTPVPEDAFYLSKLGVLGPYRERGFARGLLGRFLEQGHEHGYGRFRLDVAAGNRRAIDLYRLAGFEAVSEAALPDVGLGYVAMELLDRRGVGPTSLRAR
jgi:ribosomal protein S18 acetylase RimI-like enzyme